MLVGSIGASGNIFFWMSTNRFPPFFSSSFTVYSLFYIFFLIAIVATSGCTSFLGIEVSPNLKIHYKVPSIHELGSPSLISNRWGRGIGFRFYFFSSFPQVIYKFVDSFGGIGFICIFDGFNIFSFFSFDFLKFLCFLLCQIHLFRLFFHICLKKGMSLVSLFNLSYILIDLPL